MVEEHFEIKNGRPLSWWLLVALVARGIKFWQSCCGFFSVGISLKAGAIMADFGRKLHVVPASRHQLSGTNEAFSVL